MSQESRTANQKHKVTPARPAFLDSLTNGAVALLPPTGDPNGVRSEPQADSTATPASQTDHAIPQTTSDSRVRADSLIEALRVSRSAMEGLLAKSHAIHEESWRAVQSLLEDVHLKLCQECEARVASFEKELSDRGRYQTSALLEIADVEAASRLTARVDQALDKAQEAVRRGAQWLNDKVEVSRTSLTEITNTASLELNRQRTSSLDELQADAQKSLAAINTKYAADFEQAAQKTADSLNERLNQKASDVLQSFQERLERLAEDSTARLEEKLTAITDAAVLRLSTEAQAVVTRETSGYLIQVVRARLDQMANSLKD